MPSDLIKTITRQHEAKEWKIDELRKAIRREIDILEAGENNPSNKHEAFPNPPTAAFSIGQSRKPCHFTPSPVKLACVYCKGLHSANACTTVIDKKQRHKIV